MKLKLINFLLFFKMRSKDDFPLNSSWFVSLWPTQKCRKTRSDIILVPNLLSESSVVIGVVSFFHQLLNQMLHSWFLPEAPWMPFRFFYPTWYSHAIFFSATWVRLRINEQFFEVREEPSHFWSYLFSCFNVSILTNQSKRNKCQAVTYQEQLSNYEYHKLFRRN